MSPRKRQVLLLTMQGAQAKQIARCLGLTRGTVFQYRLSASMESPLYRRAMWFIKNGERANVIEEE